MIRNSQSLKQVDFKIKLSLIENDINLNFSSNTPTYYNVQITNYIIKCMFYFIFSF